MSADDKKAISWRTTPEAPEALIQLTSSRNELKSVVFRPAFLTIGVINASLYPDGKWPTASERLNSSVKYGATKWTTCFKTDVALDRWLTICRELPNSVRDVIDISRREGRKRDVALNVDECT